MGTRGPVKGKGGRPTGRKSAAKKPAPKKKATTRKAAPKKKSATKREAVSLANDLAALTFDELREHCSRWQSLEPQDDILLQILWELLRRYRSLAALVHKKRPDDWVEVTDRNYAHQIPQLGMLNKAIEQIMILSSRFGLSPADRIRLGDLPPSTPGENVLGSFLERAAKANGSAKPKQARNRRQ